MDIDTFLKKMALKEGKVNYIKINSSNALSTYFGSSEDYGQTLSLNTTYYMWVDWDSSGSVSVYVGNTNTKPATPDMEITGAAASNPVKMIVFSAEQEYAEILDRVMFSSVEFSEIPSCD